MDKHVSIDIISDALATAYSHGGFTSFIRFAEQISEGANGYSHLPHRKSALATVMGLAVRGRLGQTRVSFESTELCTLEQYKNSLNKE
jgi:hypothetical protein